MAGRQPFAAELWSRRIPSVKSGGIPSPLTKSIPRNPWATTFPSALAVRRRRTNSGDLSLFVNPAANHGSISNDDWVKTAAGSEDMSGEIDFGMSPGDLHVQHKSATATARQNHPTFRPLLEWKTSVVIRSGRSQFCKVQ